MPFRNQWSTASPSLVQDLARAATDLRNNGPLYPIEVHPPQRLTSLTSLIVSGQPAPLPPTPVTGFALIDSGASRTAVDESALQQLGVAPISSTQVFTPSGNANQLLYPAEFVFIGMGRYKFAAVIGSPHLKAQGILALVGRDVLGDCVFIYNGPAGMFSLCFL